MKHNNVSGKGRWYTDAAKKIGGTWEKSLRTPDVKDIFLHKSAKFHVKTIISLKVMKVCTQSLKNAIEQHDKVIQAS